MSEEIQTSKWSDRAFRQGAAEKHIVAKVCESRREFERKLRGVVEGPSSLGQENPGQWRQKMPKRAEV